MRGFRSLVQGLRNFRSQAVVARETAADAKLRLDRQRRVFECRQALKTHSNFAKLRLASQRSLYSDDHYDYSLFGLDSDMDQAVGRHQRQVQAYGK